MDMTSAIRLTTKALQHSCLVMVLKIVVLIAGMISGGNMATKLVTTMHDSGKAARNGEMELCLEMNQAVFDEVFVVAEGMQRTPTFRGQWHDIRSRQTFSDLIAASFGSKPSDLVVLANNDILFTPTSLDQLNDQVNYETAVCLTRWDISEKGIQLFNRSDSQDAWAFRGVPRIRTARYHLGMPGCENRFAHELLNAGYNLTNPSKDIRVFHMHLTGYRPSNKAENRVQPPYVYIQPAHIGTPAKITKSDKPSSNASAF